MLPTTTTDPSGTQSTSSLLAQMESIFGQAMLTMPAALEKSVVPLGDIIADRFIIVCKLNTGINSDIFGARDTIDGKEYAVKISAKAKNKLENEADIYRFLGGAPKGIPEVVLYDALPESPEASLIVMEKLGMSIKHYWDMCGNRFGHLTAARIAIQVVERLRFVHKRGVLHRDISADNLVMGGMKKEESTVYLIDFGISRRYLGQSDDQIERTVITKGMNEGTKEEITNGNTDCNIEGSTSEITDLYDEEVRGHYRGEISRRDDLISLGYTLVRLVNGSLPWEGKLSISDVREIERSTSRRVLCKGLPQSFRLYFQYVDSLEYSEEPDYNALVLLFKDFIHGMTQFGGKKGVMFEWMDLPEYVPPAE